jgi:uncharacterized protein
MKQQQTILITGGTGLIGKALTKALLLKGYNVIILTRNAESMEGGEGLQYAEWNIEKQTIDTDALKQADYIIHLAGAGVADKRWTAKRKLEIQNSRTKSGALLVKVLQENPNKVKALICASAIGWYGADSSSQTLTGKNGFEETAPAANDFLGQTCKLWEQSTDPLLQLNKRLVKLRIGIVLSNNGGALKEFKKPLRFGLATILGSGKQIISWIHIDDLVQLFIYALENENMNGVYNAAAPNPVSNKELILAAAKSRGKFYIPVYVPSLVLKLMLGEMSIEVLKSTTVSSRKVQDAGFHFSFPYIETALKQLSK